MKKIIYTFILLFNLVGLLAQNKLEGFPGEEIRIYYLPRTKDKMPRNMILDHGYYWIGENRQQVISSLNEIFPNKVDQTKSDSGDRNEFWVLGLGIGFHEKTPNYWYDIFMYNEPKGNYFFISKKYFIRLGYAIPQKLLDEVKYTLYAQGKPLTDQQAAILDKSIEREYYFKINMPNSNLWSDNIFTITVKEGVIQQLRIGTYE